jgi:hypothetical protein
MENGVCAPVCGERSGRRAYGVAVMCARSGNARARAPHVQPAQVLLGAGERVGEVGGAQVEPEAHGLREEALLLARRRGAGGKHRLPGGGQVHAVQQSCAHRSSHPVRRLGTGRSFVRCAGRCCRTGRREGAPSARSHPSCGPVPSLVRAPQSIGKGRGSRTVCEGAEQRACTAADIVILLGADARGTQFWPRRPGSRRI